MGSSDPSHSLSLVRGQVLAGAAGVDGVAAVIPVLSRTMEIDVGGTAESGRLIALDASPAAVPQGASRRFFPPQGRFVIDRTFSRKSGLEAGDSADFAGIPLVVDHVEPASGEAFTPFLFLNFADAQRIFGVDDIVNYGMVILDDPATERTVAAGIEESNPRLHAFTSRQFATAVRKEIDESFIPIITVLLVIGFVVGAAVVGLTIYTATIERSREFGVMKAVGASSGFLYRIVLAQSSMLTAAGFALGVVSSLLVARLVRELVPDFITEFELTDIVGVLAATIAMAIVASFMPVRRIIGIEPAMVFRA
jgi:putative ABC transport system permease protein